MIGGPSTDDFVTVEVIVTQAMVGYIELLECKICGSAVTNREQHVRWHNLNRIGFG